MPPACKKWNRTKRYTLAAALLRVQLSRVLDDLGQMFIKRMMRIHRRAKEALALHRLKHQGRTDSLVRTLREVVNAYQTEGDAPERLVRSLGCHVRVAVGAGEQEAAPRKKLPK
jgi:hypothetical protein